MEICCIFVGIYSVRWERGGEDAFQATFREWQDVEALETFFEDNASDLKGGFFGRMTVERAVKATMLEAQKLERRFVELSKMEEKHACRQLESMFRPLDDLQWRKKAFSFSKAKGSQSKSWLRLYAVKVDEGTFVITGGTIKLTHKLQERPHTRQAIKKLEQCLNFLKGSDVVDSDSLYELVFDQ